MAGSQRVRAACTAAILAGISLPFGILDDLESRWARGIPLCYIGLVLAAYAVVIGRQSRWRFDLPRQLRLFALAVLAFLIWGLVVGTETRNPVYLLCGAIGVATYIWVLLLLASREIQKRRRRARRRRTLERTRATKHHRTPN